MHPDLWWGKEDSLGGLSKTQRTDAYWLQLWHAGQAAWHGAMQSAALPGLRLLASPTMEAGTIVLTHFPPVLVKRALWRNSWTKQELQFKTCQHPSAKGQHQVCSFKIRLKTSKNYLRNSTAKPTRFLLSWIHSGLNKSLSIRTVSPHNAIYLCRHHFENYLFYIRGVK